LAAIARWTLVGTVVLGSLSWWWVGYHSWAGLTAAVLVVLGLWLMWRTVARRHTVPGHPIHLVLAAPAAILACHFVRHAFFAESPASRPLAGELDVAMVFHLALAAALIMLTQSLFPRAARHVVVLAVCGAAMMGSSIVALAWQGVGPVADALTLLGFAGVAVWLSVLWGLAARDDVASVPRALRRRDMRLGCIGAAAVAAAVLARLSPVATVWAAVIVGLTLVVGGVVFARHRLVLLLAGGVLSAGGLFLSGIYGHGLTPLDVGAAGAFGSGEAVFGPLSARSGGGELLLATTGWVGAGCAGLGGVLCVVALLVGARRRGADQGRAIVWLAGTMLASAAVMMRGGTFVPAVTLAAGFTWGMWPPMLGRPIRERRGAVLLVPVALLMLALGVARSGGLVMWIARTYGYGENVLHGLGGVVLAAALAWLFGSRRWWAGLAGIAVAAALGGAGELAQRVATSWRDADMGDWAAHAAGSALVIVPYLLCLGSRLCESVDAASSRAAADPRAYGREGR